MFLAVPLVFLFSFSGINVMGHRATVGRGCIEGVWVWAGMQVTGPLSWARTSSRRCRLIKGGRLDHFSGFG